MAGLHLIGLLMLGFMLISWRTHEDVEKAPTLTDATYSTATGVVLTLGLAAVIIVIVMGMGGASAGGDDGAMLRALLGG